MPKFPSRKYPDAGTFVADYVRLVATGLTSVRSSEIDRAATALKQAIRDRLFDAADSANGIDRVQMILSAFVSQRALLEIHA